MYSETLNFSAKSLLSRYRFLEFFLLATCHFVQYLYLLPFHALPLIRMVGFEPATLHDVVGNTLSTPTKNKKGIKTCSTALYTFLLVGMTGFENALQTLAEDLLDRGEIDIRECFIDSDQFILGMFALASPLQMMLNQCGISKQIMNNFLC